MPSSTFSSNRDVGPSRAGPARYAGAVRSAVATACLMLVMLEGLTRFGFSRVSKIATRIEIDYRRAVSLHRRVGSSASGVLIVGNSLLLFALDYDAIQRNMAPDSVVRFAIESTEYLDWYYGLRRLLASGSRPDLALVCLSPGQLIGRVIRGDFSSYYLFQFRDIPAVAREAGYSLTEASSLAFARYSLFYAGRNNVRQFALNRFAPRYAEVAHWIVSPPGAIPSSHELATKAEVRLRRLKDAVEPYGAKLVVAIPPGGATGVAEVVAAGERAGVKVLVPVTPGSLPATYFIDGYHVNAAGAKLFTEGLEDRLKPLLR
jgi:hypothetical protein